MRLSGGSVFTVTGFLLGLSTIVAPVFSLPRAPNDAIGAVDVRARQTPPKYTGPKDEENIPTFEGLEEYALQNWPVSLDADVDMVFWTGMAVDKQVANDFIAAQSKETIWFETVFPAPGGRGVSTIISDMTGALSDYDFMKFARTSGVYAKLASGTIFVLIPPSVESVLDPYPGVRAPPGQPRGPDNGKAANFATYELPLLTRNAQVQSIIRVDPSNFESQTTIWTQGDAPMGAVPDFNDYSPPRWPSDGGPAPPNSPDPDDGNNDV